MQKLLKSKLFIILLVFILISFSFISFSKANNEITYIFNKQTYNITLPENLVGNFVICRDNGSYTLLYTTSSGYFKITQEFSDGKYGIMCYSDKECTKTKPYNILVLFSSNTTLDYINGNIGSWKPTDYQQRYDFQSMFYSSVDVYYNGELFFQLPPQGITQMLVAETTKAQIMEQMKIIVVGFLKYLIVFVVSLIAFWKGWQFLLGQLRKA